AHTIFSFSVARKQAQRPPMLLKPQAIWAASLPLFLGRRLLPKSSPSPPPSGRRLPFRPICKRRMSAQADPRFAPLPTAQSEADAGGRRVPVPAGFLQHTRPGLCEERIFSPFSIRVS
uniref:Uncharacterized protein n=1 Tax=Aegilops tauschii subsp. strangulata TaxID=200361 RepID=A0A452Z0Q1_AEGTS